jgi:outer membrane receptor protein involved in Fe transport
MKMKTGKKFWLFAASAAAALTTSGAALAQEATDEIVVTATKRETRLQDVPVAVTPVTAEMIQNSGIKDLQDVTSVAPALQFNVSENETSATARLRGIGTQGSNPGLESAVGIFIDGVYRARNGVGLGDLGEVSQIEVLRGPQGTLFGRNTSAGLISVNTAQPNLSSFGANASLSYGNYNATRVDGSVNIPLVEDTLGLRLFAAMDKRDGFLEMNKAGANPAGGAFPAGAQNLGAHEVNNRDMWTVRGQMLWDITPDFSAKVILDYTERDEQCCAAKLYNPQLLNGAVLLSTHNTINPGGIPQDPFQPSVPGVSSPGQAAIVAALGGYGPGGLSNAQRGGGDVGQRFGFANHDFDQQLEDKGVSLQLDWDTGAVNWTSITAFRDWGYKRGQDSDFTQADLFYQRNDGFNGFGFEIFTQELRAAFQLGPVDSIVGLFFADETLTSGVNTQLGSQAGPYLQTQFATASPILALATAPLTTNPGFGDARLRDAYTQEGRSLAWFTHNIWAVDDKTDITVGLRYTDEQKDFRANYQQTFNPGTAFVTGLTNAGTAAGVGAALVPFANCGTALPSGALAPFAAVVIGARTGYCLVQVRQELAGIRTQTREEKEWSGIVSARREFTDNTSGYASYSRGYKGGGFNLDRNYDFTLPGGGAFSTAFPAEFVDAFEIGLKNSLMGGDLLLNIATYWNKYENYQLNTFNGVSFQVSTVPEVTSTGIEVDAIWNTPIEGLSYQGGVSYNEAEYGDDTGWVVLSSNPLNPTARPVNFRLPGSRLTNAPLWTATGSFTYEKGLFNDAALGVAYLDFRYVSSQVTGSDLESTKVQPEYVMFNGRLALKTQDERWSVELWGRNLTDKAVQQIAFNVPLQGNARGAFLGDPRTYGITLRTEF